MRVFRRLRLPITLLLVGWAFSAVVATGRADGELEAAASEFTARITAELEESNPEAAELFRRADAAREREEPATALELYGRVLELEPRFHHAMRRQAWILLSLGRRSEALSLSHRAMAHERSPENMLLLAAALIDTDGETQPTKQDIGDAEGIAEQLVDDEAIEPEFVILLCQVAIAAEDLTLLTRCAARLHRDRPDWVATDFFRWQVALYNGRIDEALAILEDARLHGMSEEEYTELVAITEGERPWLSKIVGPVKWVAISWLGSMVLLVIAGLILSGVTLRAAQRLPSVSTGEAVGQDRVLRKTYQVVLWLSCALYYVSLPLIVVVVVVFAAGAIYLMLQVGRVPIKLLLVIVIVVVVTLWAVLKSLLVRGRDEDPGERLDLEKHPRFKTLLQDVAAKIETRPVDNVYLTPGTEVAVMERGGVSRQLRHESERCLILGVGVLEGFKTGAFRAILGHEYGHFSNRDTAGGGFALAVRRSLITMAMGLASGGAATWYNPAWLFLQGFYKVFLRISHGASRLQEVLADRWAAFAYGARAFEEGLRHVIERSIRFDLKVRGAFKEVIDDRRPLSNLYQHTPTATPDEDEIVKALDAALNAPPSPYDSHPSPKDRFAWVRALATPSRASGDVADEQVWDLFEDRAAIEQQMTKMLRDDVIQAYAMQAAAEIEAEG